MQNDGQPDPARLQQAFNRLADVLRQPQARQRLRDDPRGFLASSGIEDLPEAAVTALTDLTPQELELFSRVHAKLADVPGGVPGGYEACIIF